MRKLLAVALLAVALLVPTTAVSAASHVKIPHSAAEWASFTPEEQADALAWVWQQAANLGVDNALEKQAEADARLAQIRASGHGRGNTIRAYSASYGGVGCGVSINHYPFGSFARGWINAWTNTPVWSLQVSATTYRNGGYFQSFGAGGGGTSYMFASSAREDFTWYYENITYNTSGWGSAQNAYGSYVPGMYYRYCSESRSSTQ